jgi:hypothetical protein
MQRGFVVNPRRAPRAPARCRASVLSAAGVFQADTEDVGAHGCQLIGARKARSGDMVQLEISNELVTGALRVAGRIAWATEVEPWRLGVAFDAQALPRARDWFERLVASHPGVGAFRRVPDRIPVDAPVFLGPPPRLLADFTREEVALLREVGDGVLVREVVSRAGARWSTVQRSFFSLLARQHLTLLTRVAVPRSSWASVLDEAERSPEQADAEVRPPLAVMAAGDVPLPAGAARASGPTAPPSPYLQHGPSHGGQPSRHGPDFVGAGVGWRGAGSRPRSAEAQQCLDLARAEIGAGRVNGALALLRRALALAPGDPEIAGTLGQLAFKDRVTYGR